MTYNLLPFRFGYIGKKVFLTNEVGEYCIVTKNDLKDIIKGTLLNNTITYENLKSKHFLTDHEIGPVVDLLAVKYRTKKAFINSFTSLHMVIPTLRCNSNCIYCQASSKEKEKKNYDMDTKTAKIIVETIFKTRSKYIKIEFQGGEPLLNIEIVYFIIEYAKKLNKVYKKDMDFVVCTNLILVDRDMLKYFKSNKVYISTSLDGNSELHGKNRPLRDKSSSYNLFLEKVMLSKEILGIKNISALMTTTRDSLIQPENIVDEYIKLGFSSFFVRMLNPYGLAETNRNNISYSVAEFFIFYKRILTYIIKLNINGTYFVEEYTTNLLSRILTPFANGFVDMQNPSGSGIGGVVYYYNGDVFPSDEARMLAEMGESKFFMGNVKTNSYEEIFYSQYIKDLLSKTCLEITPICSNCVFLPYCGSDPVRNYSEQGDIVGYKMNNNVCTKNKLVIEYLINLIEEGGEEVNDVFWSWITRKSYKELNLRNN